MDEYVFRAVYGKTTIKGDDFQAVADALVERGFDMTRAEGMADGTLKVPHTQPRRQAARMMFDKHEPPPPAPDPLYSRLAAAYETALVGGRAPGLRTRNCGAVHSDGVVCLLPVLFEALNCGCGDMVYPHEGPHESCDTEGVRYRWEEVLVIQDLPFDTYSEAASA